MPERYTARHELTGRSFSFLWDKETPPTEEDLQRIFEEQLTQRVEQSRRFEESRKAAERTNWLANIAETVLPFTRMMSPVVPEPATGAPTLRGGMLDIGPELQRIYHGIGQAGLEVAERTRGILPWQTPQITPEIRQRITGVATREPEPLAAGLRKVVGGSLSTIARPLMPVGLATAPIPTLAAIVAMGATHPQVEKGATALGVPPETAGLTADVLSAIAGGVAGKIAYRKPPPSPMPEPKVEVLPREPLPLSRQIAAPVIITPPPEPTGPSWMDIQRERFPESAPPPRAPIPWERRLPAPLPEPIPPLYRPTEPPLTFREAQEMQRAGVEPPTPPPPMMPGKRLIELAIEATEQPEVIPEVKPEPAVAPPLRAVPRVGPPGGGPPIEFTETPLPTPVAPPPVKPPPPVAPPTDIAARALAAAGLKKEPVVETPSTEEPPLRSTPEQTEPVPWRALVEAERRKVAPPKPVEPPKVTPPEVVAPVSEPPKVALPPDIATRALEAAGLRKPAEPPASIEPPAPTKPPTVVRLRKTPMANVYEVVHEDVVVGQLRKYTQGWKDVSGFGPLYKTVQEAVGSLVKVPEGEVSIKLAGETQAPKAQEPLSTPPPKPVTAKPVGERIKELMDKETRTPLEESELSALVQLATKKKGQRGALTIGGEEPEIKVQREAGAREQHPVLRKVREAIVRGSKTVKMTGALRSEELKKRVARAESVKETGVAGLKARLSQLGGEMPKAPFEPIKDLTQAEMDQMVDAIMNHPKFGWWERKVRAPVAVAKLFGMRKENLQENEIDLLSKVFEVDKKLFKEAIPEMSNWWSKLGRAGLEIPNVMRSIMASYDLSAPFRQGLFFAGRKQFWTSFNDMFKAFGSEEAYQATMDRIAASPEFELMQKSRLAITEASDVIAAREERFPSTWAERVPVVGTRPSGRAYTAFLNKLRADVFSDLVGKAREAGLNVDELAPRIADYINNATGRGSLGKLQGAATILNAAFFSPRLMSSRINLLTKVLHPSFYTKQNAFVRKEYLKDLLKVSGAAVTILELARLAGAEVSADPRNTDFGKIKIGNTRVDIGGGFQQYLRLGAQLASGQTVSSATGKVTRLGKGYKPTTRLDVLGSFVGAKEAPLFSLAADLLRGREKGGKKLNVPKEIGNRFVPMVIADAVDIAKDDPTLLPLVIPATFGAGLQTYKPERGGAVRMLPPVFPPGTRRARSVIP